MTHQEKARIAARWHAARAFEGVRCVLGPAISVEASVVRWKAFRRAKAFYDLSRALEAR